MPSSNPKSLINVCICTYKRPALLQRLLVALADQETGGLFEFGIVVADNDREESARSVVTSFAGTTPIGASYWVQPTPNIALTRNLAVQHASGEYLALIDDDEFPATDWLRQMWQACQAHGVAGVLGPVLPHFGPEAPRWLVRAGFYDRARHRTGFELGWQEARTGNVLLQRKILEGPGPVFRSEFGAGGEDQDFFRRMMAQGHRFIWCDEAPVYEVVPPQRCKRSFLLKRALMRGNISYQHRQGRMKNLAKSLVAVPLYSLALPFLLILGHHLFMRYLVKLCDHLGRLLAALGLNPVKNRSN